MQFDTTLSLELVVTVLAILAAVWRLEGKFDRQLSESHSELKGDIAGLRAELKDDIAGLRTELKDDIAGLRTELKGDIAGLRTEIRRVEDKVDDCNQRLARVEGIILAREDMVDNIVESPQ